MEGQRIQIKSKTGLASAIGYLEDLIECMKQEMIFITRERKSILLKPQGPISIELNAGTKDGKEKICVEFKWEVKESLLR